jgi:signal peptidase I
VAGVRSGQLLAAVIAGLLVVSGCSLKTVRVSGYAMAPTLKDGDIRTVDTGAYGSSSPRRGDIVTYRVKVDQLGRVIGLPGETITISGGAVSVNNSILAEPYLPPGTQTTAPQADYAVPSGSYFVLNDNRAHIGGDSRTSGFVPLSAIEGKIG